MAKDSKIGWTHHTFNSWWGCLKVSPGCVNCYAETLSHRFGEHIWGPPATTSRRLMKDGAWKEPLKWHKAAIAAGERHRVFTASMSDVFEAHPHVIGARARLFDLIEQTPGLDWLLLTKRPENVMSMVPGTWRSAFPRNVWMGTSVENQTYADARIPRLLAIPAAVRFLSCEPLLGPVSLQSSGGFGGQAHYYLRSPDGEQRIHWVIVGGESGHGARMMNPNWAQSLVYQAQAGTAACFVKQLGSLLAEHYGHANSKGEAWDEIPMSLRVREFPDSALPPYVPPPVIASGPVHPVSYLDWDD